MSLLCSRRGALPLVLLVLVVRGHMPLYCVDFGLFLCFLLRPAPFSFLFGLVADEVVVPCSLPLDMGEYPPLELIGRRARYFLFALRVVDGKGEWWRWHPVLGEGVGYIGGHAYCGGSGATMYGIGGV